MASPAVDETNEPQQAKVTFRFCHECSNQLYPREDKILNTLIYQCRNCQWYVDVGASCIYRNELSGNVGETAGVIQDVASDPTLPHVDKDCPVPSCTGRDAVFFQSQQRSAETGMKLFYVCCTCGKVWTEAN